MAKDAWNCVRAELIVNSTTKTVDGVGVRIVGNANKTIGESIVMLISLSAFWEIKLFEIPENKFLQQSRIHASHDSNTHLRCTYLLQTLMTIKLITFVLQCNFCLLRCICHSTTTFIRMIIRKVQCYQKCSSTKYDLVPFIMFNFVSIMFNVVTPNSYSQQNTHTQLRRLRETQFVKNLSAFKRKTIYLKLNRVSKWFT